MSSAYANAGTFVRPYYMDPSCPDYLKPAQWTQGSCCAPYGSIFNGGYGYAPAPMVGPAPMPMGGCDPYAADDGKISFGTKVTSFVKGIFKPITNMFSSPGNFLKGALCIAGGAALIAVTGGAATPFLVGAGCVIGGAKVAKGAVGAATAKTDAEAIAAWEDMGEGSGILAASVAGSKLGKGAKIKTGETPVSQPVNNALPPANQPAGLLNAPSGTTSAGALPPANQPAGLLNAPKTTGTLPPASTTTATTTSKIDLSSVLNMNTRRAMNGLNTTTTPKISYSAGIKSIKTGSPKGGAIYRDIKVGNIQAHDVSYM